MLSDETHNYVSILYKALILVIKLYHGVSRKSRGFWYGNTLPDRILIYQRPLERISAGLPELEENIRQTVIHEVGHYFGFDEEELRELEEELRWIDRWVRSHTIQRFGPVREVTHEPDKGLVLEVAFEGLQRSSRHKSGVAMRFPRINRIRWDKPPREGKEAVSSKKPLGYPRGFLRK